ncbi:MAG: hypothetical protein KUG77_26430 [Nannocystaceae bacterium]|nr:hypothetical protein [Nannocystaceae bacterium]
MSGEEQLDAFLNAAQAAEQPRPEAVESVWAEISHRQNAGLGPSVPLDLRGVPGFSKAALPLLAKIGLLATVAGIVAVGVMQARRWDTPQLLASGSLGQFPRPAPPASLPRMRAPTKPPVDPAPTLITEAATPDPPPEPAASKTRRPTKARETATVTPAPSRLAEETALLRKAWRALDKGRSVQAATAVATHEQKFPTGALVEEREAVRTVLSCRRNTAASDQAVRSFAQRYPRSVHRARVRLACTGKKE